MPNRIIKESILTSDTIELLSPVGERHFYRTLLLVDDYGCYESTSKALRAKAYPLLVEQIPIKDIEAWQAELEEVGLIATWQKGHRQYSIYLEWEEHNNYASKRGYGADGKQTRHRRKTPEPPSNLGQLRPDQASLGQPRPVKASLGQSRPIPNPTPKPNPKPNTPTGEDKSSRLYHSHFMGAWVVGFERYWGRKADKGLRGKAGAQFKRLFYPEFGSFAREDPDRVCELIKRVWTPDEHQTTLERKCCKEGRTVGALTYLARSVLQKERASEQVEQDQKRTEARSKAEMRKLDEEVAAADREADRLAEDKITNPVKWAKSVLVDQDVTEEGLRKLLKSQFILGFHREAVKILLEELTKQPALKEA